MTHGWFCRSAKVFLEVFPEVSSDGQKALRRKVGDSWASVQFGAKPRLALQQLLKLGTPLQPIHFFVAARLCHHVYRADAGEICEAV